MPLTTPERVAAPSTVSLVVPCKATLPARVSNPELVDIPSPRVPFMVTPLVRVRAVAESLESVPFVNWSNPVPAAVLAPNNSTPLLILRPPLNVFAPPKVRAAAPVLTSAPEPAITPPKLEACAPLRVSVLPDRLTEPSPPRLPISSLAFKFNTPPALTLSTMAFANALPPTRVRLPALTAVVPLKVFTALNVSSPVPAFTRLNDPPIAPETVAALASVNVLLPTSVLLPVKLRLPELMASPRVSAPESSIAFATVRAAVESPERRPALIVNVPDPSAKLLPN